MAMDKLDQKQAAERIRAKLGTSMRIQEGNHRSPVQKAESGGEQPESLKASFDRKAYQRNYMRKWRAKQKQEQK